ncbi:MAG: DUF2088 domain-containing protein [Planctomycetota bacterium]|nr:MAG: DUF2088 domain-containing protein [Planctomycetota bacterium]
MDVRRVTQLRLDYGEDQPLCWDAPAGRHVDRHVAPVPLADPKAETLRVLRAPLEFPPLEQAVVPGDRVALAVGPRVPQVECVLAAVWEVLSGRGVRPEDVMVLQARVGTQRPQADLRLAFPRAVRRRVHVRTFDARRHSLETGTVTYLASTVGGERIYLARPLNDADVVIPITTMRFDPLLGYRGATSVLYPWLSTEDAVRRLRGQGHPELSPTDGRPLRDLVEEVGWLLGVQFAVQVVPAGRGGVAGVFAGAPDAVQRRALDALQEFWFVRRERRAATVLVSVDTPPQTQTWADVAAAAWLGRQLVQRGGRIVVLSALSAEPEGTFGILQKAEEPHDVLPALRKDPPTDVIEVTQLVDAVRWARVYLLSRCEPDLVDDLFLVPLESPEEVRRLLEQSTSTLCVDAAPFAFGRVERS